MAKKKTAKKAAKKTATKQPAKKAAKKAVVPAEPKVEAPKKEEAPKVETPKVEAPKKEEAPKVEPKVETPKVEDDAAPTAFVAPTFDGPTENKVVNPKGPAQIQPAKKPHSDVKSLVAAWVKSNSSAQGGEVKRLVERAVKHYERGLIVLAFVDGSGAKRVHLCEHDFASRDRVRSASARFSPQSFLHEYIDSKRK